MSLDDLREVSTILGTCKLIERMVKLQGVEKTLEDVRMIANYAYPFHHDEAIEKVWKELMELVIEMGGEKDVPDF